MKASSSQPTFTASRRRGILKTSARPLDALSAQMKGGRMWRGAARAVSYEPPPHNRDSFCRFINFSIFSCLFSCALSFSFFRFSVVGFLFLFLLLLLLLLLRPTRQTVLLSVVGRRTAKRLAQSACLWKTRKQQTSPYAEKRDVGPTENDKFYFL